MLLRLVFRQPLSVVFRPESFKDATVEAAEAPEPPTAAAAPAKKQEKESGLVQFNENIYKAVWVALGFKGNISNASYSDYEDDSSEDDRSNLFANPNHNKGRFYQGDSSESEDSSEDDEA